MPADDPPRGNETVPGRDRAPAAARGDVIMIAGHGQLRTHLLDRDELVIGRDPACDLVIDDPGLSRRHAVLRLGPPLTIQDLGSTNGVRVLRRTARGGEPLVLEAGESFHLGAWSFTVIRVADGSDSSSRASGRDRLRIDDPTVDGVPGFVADVAASAVSVLIQGESGVGKDVLAETLHTLSGRSGPMARINCAALAEGLIDSELFGHEKGAFTGAAAAKVGLLEAAAGGTVFLDEIGELAPSVQAKLLRAIEAREVLRIGATRPIRIDVRFIAATNRDLPAEVAARRFRHDLYFRLDGLTLVLPPLRERRQRIATLAAGFLASRAPLAPAVLAALEAHDWPGNVRELKAVIERAILLARGREVGVRHLAFSPRLDEPAVAAPAAPAPAADDAEVRRLTPEQLRDRTRLMELLTRHAGNQTRVAKELGIARGTLLKQLDLLLIPRPRG